MEQAELLDCTKEALFGRLGKAARGCRISQGELADSGIQMAQAGELSWPEALAEVIPWARMAAAHGETGDIGRLASLLSIQSQMLADAGESDASELAFGEGLALLEIASAGDETADTLTLGAMGTASARAMEWAKHYKKLWGCIDGNGK